jgi:hypothetical protein
MRQNGLDARIRRSCKLFEVKGLRHGGGGTGRAVAEGTLGREVQWAEVVGCSRMGCMPGRRKWAS